jgi:hypothetical protein
MSLKRMPFSGIWRRVGLVRADVSEENVASIFRVEVTRTMKCYTVANGLLKSQAQSVSYRLTLFLSRVISSTLKMETTSSFETSVFTRPTRRQFTGDGLLHRYRRENLKSLCILSLTSITNSWKSAIILLSEV